MVGLLLIGIFFWFLNAIFGGGIISFLVMFGLFTFIASFFRYGIPMAGVATCRAFCPADLSFNSFFWLSWPIKIFYWLFFAMIYIVILAIIVTSIKSVISSPK
jgi:hypothetical protein